MLRNLPRASGSETQYGFGLLVPDLGCIFSQRLTHLCLINPKDSCGLCVVQHTVIIQWVISLSSHVGQGFVADPAYAKAGRLCRRAGLFWINTKDVSQQMGWKPGRESMVLPGNQRRARDQPGSKLDQARKRGWARGMQVCACKSLFHLFQGWEGTLVGRVIGWQRCH